MPRSVTCELQNWRLLVQVTQVEAKPHQNPHQKPIKQILKRRQSQVDAALFVNDLVSCSLQYPQAGQGEGQGGHCASKIHHLKCSISSVPRYNAMSWHNFKSWFDNSVHCCWKRVRKRSGVDQEKSERRNEAGTTRRSRCPKQQVFFCPQDLLHSRGPFGDAFMLEGQERRTKRKRRRKRRRSERFQSSFLIFLGQSSLSLSLCLFLSLPLCFKPTAS